MSNTSKACGCGLVHSLEAWALLPFVGLMRDDEEALEMRNCPCGSTLAVPLCIVGDCGARAIWKREQPTADGLECYCDDHVDEWLRAEKRADFASSYAADFRAERAREVA